MNGIKITRKYLILTSLYHKEMINKTWAERNHSITTVLQHLLWDIQDHCRLRWDSQLDGSVIQTTLTKPLFLLSLAITPVGKGFFFFFFNFLSCLEETEHTGLLSPREQTISSQELVNNHSCINWHQRTVTLSNKTVSKLEESIRGQLLRITGKVIIFHIIPSNFQTHGTEIQYSSTVNQLCITGPLNAFKLFKKCFPTAWYKLNQDVFTAVRISEGIIISFSLHFKINFYWHI